MIRRILRLALFFHWQSWKSLNLANHGSDKRNYKMNLHTIDTGFFKLDGGAMFGVVPKSIWNKTNPADENNLCTWAMRCLLIEDEGKLILVDNVIGN